MIKVTLTPQSGNPSASPLTFQQEVIRIGRSPENDVCLSNIEVSRYHAQLLIENNSCFVVDLDSSGGTYLNNTPLTPQQRTQVTANDEIQIGQQIFRFQFEETSSLNPKTAFYGGEKLPSELMMATAPINLKNCTEFNIGRDPENDQVIPHPSVSRFHAKIEKKDESFYISDLNSTNGTYVNGGTVQKQQLLRAGDVISIGPWRSQLKIDETLIVSNNEGKLRLDAVRLNRRISQGENLLNNVSLSIEEREFVVIAGVSGGGKSTLMNALNGSRPATSGMVLVNGVDLYRNYDAYRSQIGYVPQKDIVHTELTVKEALEFAARLRMPVDTTPQEREQRLQEVLKELQLTERSHVAINALSGGQLKRVSIGVELITRPSLFFLDEATSGLDPGTEGGLMHLLRELADQGRTIILITHATENVTLCNHVAFLANGGNLAYYGPPSEAVNYFEVTRFNEIYRKVENSDDPTLWKEKYEQSPWCQTYVWDRQKDLSNVTQPTGTDIAGKRHSQPNQTISPWRQFWILTQRNLAIIRRDRASLVLMLAIAPILGVLDFFTWQRDIFNTTSGDAGQAITMLFTAALIAVMVGSLSTMRELVKEREIYRREQMIGLQLIPYLFSKVGVSIILALYQAGVFLLFKVLAVDLPLSWEVLSGFYFALFLATLSGMLLGLLVSAISPNQNLAPLLTIIVLVPQITFGGGVLPINTLGTPGLVLNHISLTKWSFESLVTITGLGADVAADPCWRLSSSQRQALSATQKAQCDCMGTEIFRACEFPGVGETYDAAVDEPEPVKPEKPEDPPSPPERPNSRSPQAQQAYQEELDEYEKAMETYQEDLDSYQERVDAWQEDYSTWKENYESAIGEAEGLINRFQSDYGNAFAVNLLKHWLILTGLMVIMFVALSFMQKRQQVIR